MSRSSHSKEISLAPCGRGQIARKRDQVRARRSRRCQALTRAPAARVRLSRKGRGERVALLETKKLAELRKLDRVPHALQWRARQDILQTTPRNIAAPERAARQCMPRDLCE
jgi:hypothetical protein